MKTSSKLLIVLGIALFVVPLSIIALTILSGRVDAVEYRETIAREKAVLGVEDVYLQTEPLKTFQRIALESEGAGSVVNLIFVKSDQYAVKTRKDGDAGFTFNVNDQGLLTIRAQESHNYYDNNIYLFAPSIYSLDLRNVNLSLKINTDSLFVHADGLRGFRLMNESAIGRLTLQANNSNVDMSVHQREETVNLALGDLQLDVSNSHAVLEHLGWKDITLHARDSKVNFINKDRKWQLNTLKLLTEGASSIGMDSLQTANLSGSISEQTTIDLPVYQLRKLMK